MIIPFGEYAPDLARLKGRHAPFVKNVIPRGPFAGSRAPTYGPFPSFGAITDALDAYARGAISAKDKDGNVFNYAGDETKLYSLNQNNWQDVSNGTYTTGSEERWEFVRWKEKILGTNFSDNPQQITFGDANFADLTTALRARHISVIKDFVVFGNTFDSSDDNVPFRVRWSAFDDETDYTVDPATLSDFQDLKGKGGPVQGIAGGDFGVVIQEDSSWRMSFVGSPVVFQFDNTAPGVGALAPGSIVSHGNFTFFLAQDGFFMMVNGVPVRESWIGANRVDRDVLADLDADNLHRVSSVIDPENHRVFWAYPGVGNVNGEPNRIVVYDWVINRWGRADVCANLVWRASSVGFTLDGLDDFALGAELVTDGDFPSATNWTTDANWAISGGVASHSAGAADDVEQTVSLTEGDWYRVEFDVINRTAGSVTPKVGGTAGTAISADDTDIKETIQAGSGSLLEFSASSDFDGDIDNVSLKRVTPLDDLTSPLDSRTYQGGNLQLAAFDENNQSGFFDGPALDAQIETSEAEITDGRETRLNSFEVLMDEGPSGDVTVVAQVGSRDSLQDPISFSSDLTQRSSRRFTKRTAARYHTIRVKTSGDFEHAIGINIDRDDITRGAKRGR